MMVTLLSLLLLAQLFTPAQEQVTSASGPPVEVLEAEVRMHELKTRIGGNPRDVKPPGAVGSAQIPGVRETIIREQPTIEDRSTELGKVARRSASEPVRSPRGYIYEYRVRVKNTSRKKIKSILWEYQLTEGSGAAIVSQRVFLCATTIKSGSVKLLAARTPSPPNRVVSAGTPDDSHEQKAIVNRVEFSDGSTWMREGWKQEADATTKGRDLRNGQCTML
jgi:hypothetical protein